MTCEICVKAPAAAGPRSARRAWRQETGMVKLGPGRGVKNRL